jgi:predicted DNA-binding transcriptional regulator AlpA
MTIDISTWPQWMKVEQVAYDTQLARSVIQRKLREGYFPNAIKLGRTHAQWRIPREDVARFLRGEAKPREAENEEELALK